MDRLAFILLLIFVGGGFAQSDEKVTFERDVLQTPGLSKKEFRQSAVVYDFGPLWTAPDNSHVLGFIGDNYKRLRIKIISAEKNKTDPSRYIVSGKSLREGRVRSFNGTITIRKARIFEEMHWGVDDEYRDRGIKQQGIIMAQYRFSEDRNYADAGIFEGVSSLSWYIGRGQLQYDDIEIHSDGYRNNQFVGTWRAHDGSQQQRCNWGDYRIPFSGDLDGGAGEFSPADKYLQYGWQSYREAYVNNSEQARREEERKWW